ncbi:hypothetical protein ACTL6U_13775 [Rhodovibrionaceae bacterium A322]
MALALLVSGCVTTKGAMNGTGPLQITKVTVKKAPGTEGSLRVEEEIRIQTQNRAYRLSDSGKEYHLDMEVLGITIHNPGRALLISSGSFASARVEVIDPENGKTVTAFDSIGVIPRTGGIIGALATADLDPIVEERLLATKLAESTMIELYGSEYVKQNSWRSQGKVAKANYPVTVEEAKLHLECKNLVISKAPENASDREGTGYDTGKVEKLPDNCLALGYELPKTEDS